MATCVQAIAMPALDQLGEHAMDATVYRMPALDHGWGYEDLATIRGERKAARLQPRKASTLRLRRIRVSYDWFQTMKARERDAFWKEVEAMFGVNVPWKLDSRVEFSFTGQHKLMVERRA
jgi:hypothetical protein